MKKIIFVCTGNTCRSPFAEGYFNFLNLKGFFAESRGFSGNGQSVSRNSALIAEEYGFDISNHISKSFTSDDFSADFIFVMNEQIKDFLIKNGGNENKIFVLGNGIFDPFGGDLSVYKKSLLQISDEIDKLFFSGFFDNIKVREIEKNDIPAVAKMEEEYFSEPWSENSVKESLENNTNFFIAEKDGEILGYVGLNFILDEGYITSISVDENHRNKGIATRLMNRCFSFARKQNLSFISLEVRASNQKAINLYAALGFTNEGMRKNFYRNPKENANIMTRRFNF